MPIRRPKMNFSIPIELTKEEIIAAFAQLSPEEVIEFVKELDLAQANWDFTIALCDHFDSLRKQYEKELEEDRVIKS